MLHTLTPICNAHSRMLCFDRMDGSWMREKREGGEEKIAVVKGEEEGITRREWVVVCGGMDGSCERIPVCMMKEEYMVNSAE